MKIKIAVFSISLFLLYPGLPAYSSEITPFRTVNQNPVVQIFGLPAIGDSRTLEAGKKELALIFDLSNNYANNSSNNERIVLDGETYLLNLTGRLGISDRFEIGFEVPYIFQSGGFLDSFIQDYHSTFDFPNGGRERASNRRLLFTYQRNGSTVFLVDKCNSGIGDIRLNSGFPDLLRKNPRNPLPHKALR